MEIEVIENIMQYNKDEAKINRVLFKKNNVLVINLLSAPGAGKTSLIIETIKKLEPGIKIGVIEGDISSTHDAQKIKKLINEVVQINTGGTCHLNASMVSHSLKKIDISKIDILFIENVGNLICPVGFDLGEDFKVVISSVSEGDDKPVKYPKIFIKSDLVLLNKIDMLDYSDFDLVFFKKKINELNNKIDILQLSCKSGEGLEFWSDWLKNRFKEKFEAGEPVF
ncbi:MAG: hydrogenase nickel incorporation protein HypB [Candidatus Humimicrobiaceae bacterium]